MSAKPYRVIAIPTATAEAVRTTLLSPFGNHPTHGEVATGHGPCRHCLRNFRAGEERRLLFTYDTFSGVESLPLPGPVFIHEERCERYREDDGFPDNLRHRALTLNAYARGRHLRAQAYVTDQEVEATIKRLLAQPEIDYINVHDTEAGCYDLRIERAAGVS